MVVASDADLAGLPSRYSNPYLQTNSTVELLLALAPSSSTLTGSSRCVVVRV